MKKVFMVVTISLIAGSKGFGQKVNAKEKGIIVTNKPAPAVPKIPTPDEVWGKLFVDIQLNRVLGDNKTFVDAVPLYEPSVILEKYTALQKDPNGKDQLKAFVEENFKIPVTYTPTPATGKRSLNEHIEELWPVLTRKADVREKYSSLLPLPFEYVVPGGRFREIYYWDSYFTMQGLAVSDRYDLVERMLDNFRFLIDTYGHIPNGNRSYYLSRSQPPYFALMVELLHEKIGQRAYTKYIGAVQREYNWWMNGAKEVKNGEAVRRVVRLKDGTMLNRYFDDKNAPREESYYEDVETGLSYGNKDGLVYRNLRAGAESGWDYSSRWFADTMNLTTIETTNIIPVDLNCLLYTYETILGKAHHALQNPSMAKQFNALALKRRKAILQYCWNPELQSFFDFDFKEQHTTNRWSLASVMPLFTKIATNKQASAVAEHLEKKFLRDGGLITTLYNTGQQWDAPNGWAPLQFLAVRGLMNYQHDSLAKTIATRWMSVNERVFDDTGKMMEKYNVENILLESGGGEYPSQDGFGWSNGVYLKFHSMFKTDGLK